MEPHDLRPRGGAVPADLREKTPPRFGSEEPSQGGHTQPPLGMPQSPSGSSDATYRPPGHNEYSDDENDHATYQDARGGHAAAANADEEQQESQFEREVSQALDDLNANHDQSRGNGEYRTRYYGAYSGKICKVPYVQHRDHPTMTSLSAYVLDPNDLGMYPQKMREYARLFNHDLSELVGRVFDDERKETRLHENQRPAFMKHRVLTLMTMSKDVVAAVIKGDVACLREMSDSALADRKQGRRVLCLARKERQEMLISSKYQPVVYAQSLYNFFASL
ncbi:hypothetical protein IWZ01DRAFT_56 [Phyllosticta capitalensis]